jgi:hypothetical protein
MFNLWRRAGLYERMTIIVHGDHGSRIYINDPTIPSADRLDAADYVDGFSTLFAVKAPGLDPAYDTRMVALQDLLAAVAHDRLDQLTTGRTEPYALLERSYGYATHAMIPRPMPSPGCAAGQRWGCGSQGRRQRCPDVPRGPKVVRSSHFH